MNKLIIFLFSFTFSLAHLTGQKISKKEYIDTYKKIAVEEMKRSGIPASITLAQGIIESAHGNSTLARKANNHFGIKCHKWQGAKVYHDDDKKNECFRKYNSPEESYRDHTDFLLYGSRYNFLFDYKSNDYKNWARGLKKAGYATSPTYAEDLIRAIEDNELYRFDEGDYTQPHSGEFSGKMQNEHFVINLKSRKIFELNRIKFIVVEEGDNLQSLTKELDLFSWQLKKYNDLPENYGPKPGEKMYIQPKRWKAGVGNNYHIAAENETMHDISQKYGVKLNKLYRKNLMEPGSEPFEGQRIWLRKKKPLEKTPIPESAPGM